MKLGTTNDLCSSSLSTVTSSLFCWNVGVTDLWVSFPKIISDGLNAIKKHIASNNALIKMFFRSSTSHQSLLYHGMLHNRCKLFQDQIHLRIVKTSQMNVYCCIDWKHCHSESKDLHFYSKFLKDITNKMINKNSMIFCIVT